MNRHVQRAPVADSRSWYRAHASWVVVIATPVAMDDSVPLGQDSDRRGGCPAALSSISPMSIFGGGGAGGGSRSTLLTESAVIFFPLLPSWGGTTRQGAHMTFLVSWPFGSSESTQLSRILSAKIDLAAATSLLSSRPARLPNTRSRQTSPTATKNRQSQTLSTFSRVF